MPDLRSLLAYQASPVTVQEAAGASATAPDPATQALIDAGYLTRNVGSYYGGGGDSGTGPAYDVSYATTSKAPTSQYGALGTFRGYDVPSGKASGWDMRNSNLWYNDPNYGPITPLSNTVDPALQKNWMDYMGPLVMAAVTAGAGSLPAFGVEAGMAAAGAAGAAGAATSSTIPWYVNALMSGAKVAGGMMNPLSPNVAQSVSTVNKQLAMPTAAQPAATPTAAPAAQAPMDQASATAEQFGYSPALYGNMGSMAGLSDGTQMVAGSIAPDAYSNSYTQVIS